MAIYLLDTSVIIDTINGKRHRDQLLKELLYQGHLLACCAINVIEVYAGLRSHEEPHTSELLQSLQYYPITWPVARLAGLLKRDYSRKGVTLAATDVTIAAVAILSSAHPHYRQSQTLPDEGTKSLPAPQNLKLGLPKEHRSVKMYLTRDALPEPAFHRIAD
jgi:predicted nucleic acid-binding protein